MTLVREGSSEGRRPRVRGRRFGDRRYHRRSLGWLTATVVAAVATTVVVRGGYRGQVRADQCGHVREIAQGSIPGLSGEARPLCFSLCHSSRTSPISTSVCSDSHFASLVPGLLNLIFSLSPRSFTRISLFREMLSLTDRCIAY